MRLSGSVVGFVIAILVFDFCESNDDGKTTILKCCKYGEELGKPPAAGGAAPRCVPSSVLWKPFIYSPSKGNVVPELPDSWHVVEGRVPQCREPDRVLTHVPYSQFSPFIILDVGHAILESGTGAQFEPSEYCADSRALLVCAPKKIHADRAAATMRPKVYRCCGDHAAFHENR